jgi:hypothetical protein
MTKEILADSRELVFIQSRAETNHDLVDEYAKMVRRETARRIDVTGVCETMSRQSSQAELG